MVLPSLLGAGCVFCYGTPVAAQIRVSRPSPQTVTVHVAASGAERIPPAIFGGFLEPIGNSINNGIAAEILVNRSLEGGLWNHVNLEAMYRDQPELIASSNSTGIPLPWQALDRTAGNRFELHVGDAANSWQSLEIMGQPDELTGIRQRVYLPVQRELEYHVTLYAKHVSGPDRLTLSFRDPATNKSLAEAHVDAPSQEWTKYHATLRLTAGQVARLAPVHFAVAVEGDERVDVDQFSLMPADAIGTLDPDAVRMAREMHITELRLGGNFSSYYHWRDGIGPEDRRLTMRNIAWGIPEYNNLGTDEFLALCDQIGATPQFDLNMGSGTPEEAADWVRYIHAHHSGPVIYELGNELYGKWQVGAPGVEQIAARTLAFSKAVRAVDQNARLIATGIGAGTDTKWVAAQLSNPPDTFNDLSLHYIVGTNRPEFAAATREFTAAAAYAVPYAAGPWFDRLLTQADAQPEWRGKLHFAITEWLFNSKGAGERNFTNESPSWMNAGGAVLAAGFFNTVLRHAPQVDLTDMTGLMEFAGIWKRREQVYAVPAYYAFQMYTVVKGDTLLTVTSDSGAYDISNGDRPVAEVKDVPYIDVVATRSADRRYVTLLCVNRSLDGDIPVRFDLGSLRVTGPIAAQQIGAANRFEQNDEVQPTRVTPRSVAISGSGRQPIAAVLPHESVTVVRVPVTGGR